MCRFSIPNLGFRLFNFERCFEILNRLRTELTRFSGYDVSDSIKLPEILKQTFIPFKTQNRYIYVYVKVLTMPYCTTLRPCRATVSLLISLTSQRTNCTYWGHRFLEKKTYQLNLPSIAVVIVEATGSMPSTFVCKQLGKNCIVLMGAQNVQFNKNA